MAIISKRNFKTQLGDTDLELEAKTGQSLLIKDIKIYNPASDYITVSISKTTVGYFRVGGVLGSHLPFPIGRSEHSHDFTMSSNEWANLVGGAYAENAGGVEDDDFYVGNAVEDSVHSRIPNLSNIGHINHTTLLTFLFNLGLFTGYPVASGEKFVITGAKQDKAVQCVEYEIWEEPDFTPDMENGSKSNSYLYVNYGSSGAAINVETDVILTTANNPAEFPDFPFGNIVPAARIIELHGILASDVKPLASTDSLYTVTKFLKFMQGKEFLFDADRQGLLFYAPLDEAPGDIDIIAEGRSLGGNYSTVDLKHPFLFEPPLIFPQGQELTIAWQCEKKSTGAAISVALQEIGLILKMIPFS